MRIASVVLGVAALLLLSACEEQGPMERAGEQADEAIENLREGGESLGDRVDDAIDEARDRASDAVDEAGRRLEELGND